MPYVTLMGMDKREGVADRGETVDRPTRAEMVDALCRLDGETYTQLYLEGAGRTMMVGGGNDGLYTVYIAVEVDREFYNLVNPDASPTSQLMLVTGGQVGIFPASRCVELKAALKAAEVFFERGEPAESLEWQRV